MRKIITFILLIIVIRLFSQEFDIIKTNEFAVAQSYWKDDCIIEENGYLYTLSSYGLEIYEIENNGELSILSRFPITADISFAIHNNYAYISAGHTIYDTFCGKLYQINIADKENPYIEQQLDFEYNPYPVQIYNDYLHLRQYDRDIGLFVNYFYSLPDLSLIAQYEDYLKILEKIDETTAIRADGYNTFTVFDLTDPTNPEIIGNGDVSSQHYYNIHRSRTYNDTILVCSVVNLITFWDVSDWYNWEYISQYQPFTGLFSYSKLDIIDSKIILPESGHVELVDISDISQPYQLDIISGTSSYFISSSCTHYEDNIYKATNCNGIERISLIDNTLIFEEEIAEYFLHALSARYGNYLITSTFLHGFKYFDISDPNNTVDMGELLPAYNHDFQISGNYLSAFWEDNYDYDIYDISDIHAPVLRNTIETVHYSTAHFDGEDNSAIYLVDQYNYNFLKYDISEPGINELLFETILPCNMYCEVIHNGYGYFIESVNNYQNLYIYKDLDINNPTLCNVINNISHKSVFWIKTIGEYLCIFSVFGSGFYISPDDNAQFFNLADPENPELEFELGCPGHPIVNNDLVFTTTLWSSYVFDISDNPTGVLEPIHIFYDINLINNISFFDYEDDNYLLLSQGSSIGVFEYEHTSSSFENEIIKPEFMLSNYPNPFNPETTIKFTAENAEIIIYNLKGQKVKTFTNHQINKSSNQQIIWNGTDDNNKAVSSGIYLYKLKVNDKTLAARKCILLK